MAERRIGEASSVLDRVRALRAATSALSSGARQRSTDSQTTATRSGAIPPRRSARELAREQLDGSACSRSFEEANRAVERRARLWLVGEELALELR